MPKTNIIKHKKAHTGNELFHFTNATFELVKWPFNSSDSPLDDKVFAIQTTRYSPQQAFPSPEKSPFDCFNLGQHVGDIPEQVNQNRDILKQFINQQLSTKQSRAFTKIMGAVQIQWLEQVHGNDVVTVSTVNDKALIADACITRNKNIALAIMTADCLPILLSHKDGIEVAAIHGGWRPLALNIIANTIEKMHSEPDDITAWIGPSIGKRTFEVGSEVKDTFIKLDSTFKCAFLKQDSSKQENPKQGEVKYLADLPMIARLQLNSLGITKISNLEECTYQNTNKYYSYRKDKITGRMASVICRR